MTGAVAAAAPSWAWGRFASFDGGDVYDLLALRGRVFVMEQACLFVDADGLDPAAWHLLGRDGSGALVAYLRCLAPGARYAEPSIGRVVVAPSSRASGLGRVLMVEGIARTQALWPDAAIRINAQARLEAFYGSLGFRTEGVPYDEDGIEHVEMRLAPRSAGPRQETGS